MLRLPRGMFSHGRGVRMVTVLPRDGTVVPSTKGLHAGELPLAGRMSKNPGEEDQRLGLRYHEHRYLNHKYM